MRNFKEEEYLIEITGFEFKETGALWFVNNILHLFGMAIAINTETGDIKAYNTRFRGFSEECNDDGYKKLTKYLQDNIDDLNKEL